MKTHKPCPPPLHPLLRSQAWSFPLRPPVDLDIPPETAAPPPQTFSLSISEFLSRGSNVEEAVITYHNLDSFNHML